MPDRIDKALFLLGLLVYTAGQVMLRLTDTAMRDQHPVDFTHWLLLIGVVLLIPYAARLPRRGFHLVTGPVLILGIVAVIGMNILDFAFWALPPDLDGPFYEAVSDKQSVWWPFMRYGPNELFITAFVLPSLMLFKVSRIGTGLVIAGALTMAIGTQWFNVLGYVLVIAGYFLCFDCLRGGTDQSVAEPD